MLVITFNLQIDRRREENTPLTTNMTVHKGKRSYERIAFTYMFNDLQRIDT